MIINSKLRYLVIFFLLIPVLSSSQVRLPKLISDGMVLQRDANV